MVHAEPRFTKDLDVWVEPTPENAGRVHAALKNFGAPLQMFTQADLERLEMVIQIGIPPNRIDVITSIDGVNFDEAWSARSLSSYGSQQVPVISVDH